MSFSSETKNELCRVHINEKQSAIAECYGVLLYCNTFSNKKVKIITESGSFASRLLSLAISRVSAVKLYPRQSLIYCRQASPIVLSHPIIRKIKSRMSVFILPLIPSLSLTNGILFPIPFASMLSANLKRSFRISFS